MLKQISTIEAMTHNSRTMTTADLERVAKILGDVKTLGDKALLDYGVKFGDLLEGSSPILGPDVLQASLASIDASERALLEDAATRIRSFAKAQRSSIQECTVSIEGGRAGQTIRPLESAACYAPGGRYPLPSSVLMTVIPAKVAGVENVWVLSPRPSRYTLAAAAIAGADSVLSIGGAQAIAAVAYGTETVPWFDIVVGPGNQWVTAAKQLVFGDIAIDMLAGPSELLIITDESGDPKLIAADLLAQAEHDPDARVGLIAASEELLMKVERELTSQLRELSTREIAIASLMNSYAIVAAELQTIAQLSDAIAPEHLSLHMQNCDRMLPLLKNYGALFIGPISAEVFGDYGLGPNHVLPTGKVARYRGGLSVYDFLRIQTWMQLDEVAPRTAEAIASFARMEGLAAHARSALLRSNQTNTQVPTAGLEPARPLRNNGF